MMRSPVRSVVRPLRRTIAGPAAVLAATVAAGHLVGIGPAGGPTAARAATFRFDGTGITVPDGFTVERAAAAPLVERPVSLAFDDEGRLHVAESSGSNAKLVEQRADPRHRILRLEDADGDGVFDRRTVFADGLEMLQGTLWYRGSLYVASGPRIVRLTDTDGDGTADDRAVWFDGRTLTGCGNDMHGPALGRDGWFYWCKGAFAEQTHDLPGRPGWKTRAAHVFRARPDRPVREIEPVLTGGMDNPVDVAFAASGERFLSATFLEHPAGGRRDGVVHAVYGGVYGKEHGVLDGHPRTGDLLPVLVQLGPAAACGLHVHSGHGLGGEFADDLFACSFNLRAVSRHRLRAGGGSFATVDEPFLTADAADFHPTDVIEDADGSLLVVDTGGWYKLCCPTSQLEKPAVFGGIYRVRRVAGAAGRPAAASAADPRGRRIDWQRLDDAALVALLADERPAVVARAADLVAQRGGTAVAPLARLLRESPAPRVRREAVWAAVRIDDPAARPLLVAALADPAVEVRHAAAHAAGLLREPDAVAPLAAILAGDHGGAARAAAEALGRIGGAQAVAALLAACPRAADRVTAHSLTYALLECGLPGPLRAALEANDPRTRRAALVACEQLPRMHAGGPTPDATQVALRDHVLAACRDDDADLRDAGWWIASRHPEWAGALAAAVEPELARTAARPAEASRIVARLAGLAADPAVAAALAAAVRADTAAVRTAATAVMRAARPAAAPDAWVESLTARIAAESASPESATLHSTAGIGDALDTLAKLALSAAQRARARPALLALAARPATPPKLCTLAVQVAAAAPPDRGQDAAGLPDDVVARLVDLLLSAGRADDDESPAHADHASAGPAASPLDRSAAAAALVAAGLADDRVAARQPDRPDQLARLAPALGRLPPNDVAQLLPLYARRGGGPLEAALVAVAANAGAAAIAREPIAAAVAALPADRAAWGAELLDAVDRARAGQRQAYERLAATLPPGDPARGHVVFQSSKAACAGCHAMAYVGGRIGPDLSKIGAVRTPRDLLEAIVLPSASFVRSYEPVTVLTIDGRAHAGIVLDDTAAEIVLQATATQVERIPRGQVESVEPGTVSLMPKGYDTLLTPQELADLVAFLARAK